MRYKQIDPRTDKTRYTLKLTDFCPSLSLYGLNFDVHVDASFSKDGIEGKIYLEELRVISVAVLGAFSKSFYLNNPNDSDIENILCDIALIKATEALESKWEVEEYA